MTDIYNKRRIWKILFFVVSGIIAVAFLYISNNLIKDLSAQERERMEIWANATKEIATTSMAPSTGEGTTNIDFLLSIIEANHNIPVLLCDDHDQIILQRNFNLPEPIDSLQPTVISKVNEQFLQKKLQELKRSSNIINIQIDKS